MILKDWENYFEDRGLSDKLKSVFLPYVEDLISNELPVIFEPFHLSLLLGLEYNVINKMINGKRSFYYEYMIPKRSGGFRKIHMPYPSLMKAQNWIYRNILNQVVISPNAHGFVNGKNIKSNALSHLNTRCLLKIDLQNFFPSIKINRVIPIFQKLGYPDNVSYSLASLVTYKRSLPQGAPSSPAISNIIAKRLDLRIGELCNQLNLNYTRYADDIAISGENITQKMAQWIFRIINNEKFRINRKKTVLIRGPKSKRIVTGLSVKGSEVKLPRVYKKSIRQESYFLIKHGLETHLRHHEIRDPFYLERVIGKLRYWVYIEPNNAFAKTSLEKLLLMQAESIQ